MRSRSVALESASLPGAWRRAPASVLTLCGLVAVCPTRPLVAQDGIRIHEERQTYRVTGRSDREIWASLLEGARRDLGDPVFAWTEVVTEYRFPMRRSDDGCRIVGAEIEVRIVVTLPEWTAPRDAPLSLRRKWNRYQAAIRRHEDGHVRRARETAGHLQERLIGLADPDCETLQERGRRIGREVLEWGRGEQDRYDAETRHGITQGVRWRIDPGGP